MQFSIDINKLSGSRTVIIYMGLMEFAGVEKAARSKMQECMSRVDNAGEKNVSK